MLKKTKASKEAFSTKIHLISKKTEIINMGFNRNDSQMDSDEMPELEPMEEINNNVQIGIPIPNSNNQLDIFFQRITLTTRKALLEEELADYLVSNNEQIEDQIAVQDLLEELDEVNNEIENLPAPADGLVNNVNPQETQEDDSLSNDDEEIYENDIDAEAFHNNTMSIVNILNHLVGTINQNNNPIQINLPMPAFNFLNFTDVPVPVPEDLLKTIPILPFKSEMPYSRCNVCFEDFKTDESVRELLCKHLYHPVCIDTWFKEHPDCPICHADQRDLAKIDVNKGCDPEPKKE